MGNLIIINSLPRSGSTFLQNLIIENNPNVLGDTESWVFLALFLEIQGKSKSQVGGNLAEKAKMNFIERNGKELVELFLKYLEDEGIFIIEKTPRNYWLGTTFLNQFDNIVLVRRPDEILASMISTWNNNHLYGLYKYINDFKVGTKVLGELKGVIIRYDELYSLENFVSLDGTYFSTQKKEFKRRIVDTKYGDQSWSKGITTNQNAVFTNFLRYSVLKYFLSLTSDEYMTRVGKTRLEILNIYKPKMYRIDKYVILDCISIFYVVLRVTISKLRFKEIVF